MLNKIKKLLLLCCMGATLPLFADLVDPEPLIQMPMVGETTILIYVAELLCGGSLLISVATCWANLQCKAPADVEWRIMAIFSTIFYLPYILLAITGFDPERFCNLLLIITPIAILCEAVYLLCSRSDQIKSGQYGTWTLIEITYFVGIYGTVFFCRCWLGKLVEAGQSELLWGILGVDSALYALLLLFKYVHRRNKFVWRFIILIIGAAVSLPLLVYSATFLGEASHEKFKKRVEAAKQLQRRPRNPYVKIEKPIHSNADAGQMVKGWEK